jgi:hypothetical protein
MDPPHSLLDSTTCIIEESGVAFLFVALSILLRRAFGPKSMFVDIGTDRREIF